MPAGASGVRDAVVRDTPGSALIVGVGRGSLDEERFGFSTGQGSVSCIRPVGYREAALKRRCRISAG